MPFLKKGIENKEEEKIVDIYANALPTVLLLKNIQAKTVKVKVVII